MGLLNRSDKAHAKCVHFSENYRKKIITTEWILVEVADAWSSSPERIQAAKFVQFVLHNPQFQIVPSSSNLFLRGLTLYAKRLDKDWSLTDCISFVVMEDENVTDALTGDRHFEQAGFKILLE
ncbi:MAG: hypothetical protein M3Y82_09450 [Verrucomicrobiota bacterium]|nr:hypothetical protein [Verrucomicrobiota bacterium]